MGIVRVKCSQYFLANLMVLLYQIFISLAITTVTVAMLLQISPAQLAIYGQGGSQVPKDVDFLLMFSM